MTGIRIMIGTMTGTVDEGVKELERSMIYISDVVMVRVLFLLVGFCITAATMSNSHKTDKNIEIWKIKKLIKALEAVRYLLLCLHVFWANNKRNWMVFLALVTTLCSLINI